MSEFPSTGIQEPPPRLKAFAATGRALAAYLAGAALLSWAAFNWYTTIQRIVSCYLPLPFMDYWRVIENYAQYKALDPAFLWQQHNEHRIVFPEIVFALDMLTAHGREIVSLLASFLCYFSLWVVIAWTLLSDSKASRTSRVAAVLLAGIVIGWKSSASALARPFLLQWTMTQLAALLSLAFLTVAKTKASSKRYLCLTITAAVIATYSSGNGMFLWPVLIAAAFMLSLARRQVVALAASGVVSVGCYFIGYRFLNEGPATNVLAHPLYALEFAGAYLSMPFGAIKSPIFGAYLGLTMLAATIFLFIYAARTHLLQSRTAVVLFGFYAFTVLTAIITAAGRMNPSDPRFTNAEAARYLTVPLANWAIFISLCLWVAGRKRWKIFLPSVLTVFFLLLIALICFKLRWHIHLSNQSFADIQEAMLSVENGLNAPLLIRRFFPDPHFVNEYLPEMKQNRLSIYYDPLGRWLGQPVSRFGAVGAEPVAGTIAKACTVPSGIEVFGWADEGEKSAGYRWIVFTNEAGKIAGFGERFPAGVPSDVGGLKIPHRLSWVGFINLRIPGGAYRAYVVERDSKNLAPLQGPLVGSEAESCPTGVA
ncbi:MAG TPA: hypothetical protein VF283_23630 [Bryobacteraceae bacterium]